MVKITISWCCELKSSEADIVKSFVIDAENFISGLDELVDGKSAVVGLDDGIRNLWRWNNGVCGEDTIWIFFTELVEKECTKTRASTTTEGVNELESLESIARFGFLTDDIEDGLAEFLSLGVVSLGPVVTGTGLSEDEVIGAEKLTILASTDGIHSAWLKINKDCTRNVLAASSFVVVNVDAL